MGRGQLEEAVPNEETRPSWSNSNIGMFRKSKREATVEEKTACSRKGYEAGKEIRPCEWGLLT